MECIDYKSLECHLSFFDKYIDEKKFDEICEEFKLNKLFCDDRKFISLDFFQKILVKYINSDLLNVLNEAAVKRLYCVFMWKIKRVIVNINYRLKNLSQSCGFDIQDKIDMSNLLRLQNYCLYVDYYDCFINFKSPLYGYFVYLTINEKTVLNLVLDFKNELQFLELNLSLNSSYKRMIDEFALNSRLDNKEYLRLIEILKIIFIQIDFVGNDFNTNKLIKENSYNFFDEKFEVLDKLLYFLDLNFSQKYRKGLSTHLDFEETKKYNSVSCCDNQILKTVESFCNIFNFYLGKNFTAFHDRLPKDIKENLLKFKDCLINYESTDYFIRSFVHSYNSIKFGENYTFFRTNFMSYETIDFMCYQLWYLSKGIYRFEPNLLKCIPELDLNEVIPDLVLVNLPEWAVYVELDNVSFLGLKPLGYFAFVDSHKVDGYILNIVLHFADENIPVLLPLMRGKSYYSVLEADSKFIKYPCEYTNPFIGQDLFNISNERMFWLKRNICPNANVLDFNIEVIKCVVPQLLYLCADNSDLKNVSFPDQPIKKAAWVSKINDYDLVVNPDVSIISVGSNFVNDLDNKLSFNFNDGSLEIIHSNISSLNEIKKEQVNSNLLVRRLYDNYSKLNAKFEDANQLIDELVNENKKILDDQKLFLDISEETEKNYESILEESKNKINDLSNQIFKLQSIIQNHQFQINKLKTSNIIHSGTSLDIIGRIAHNQTYSPSQCLKIIEDYSYGKVVILQSAWDSAKDIDDYFENSQKLLNLLARLVYDYLPLYLEFGDAKAKSVFTNREYAAQESDTVLNSKDLSKQREFFYNGQSIVMCQHLKIGVSKSASYTLRIHFAIDKLNNKIVLGYCGKHLDTSSTN